VGRRKPKGIPAQEVSYGPGFSSIPKLMNLKGVNILNRGEEEAEGYTGAGGKLITSVTFASLLFWS
jgi:hypothetical protein